LHEQLLSYIKYPIQVDKSHFFVKSYFDEYQNIPNATSLHHSDFANHRLFLESEDTYPELQVYIKALVESVSSGQTAILQFNRIDFRLAWIKKNFSNARLLHLYRNPRDQWYSTLTGFPGDIDQSIDFDQYSLATWARDLYGQFPFLATPHIEHAYQRFYYIWKLSYLAGQRLADLSVSYEDILVEPSKRLTQILKLSNLYSDSNLDACLSVVVSKPERGWSKNRSDEWFLHLEQKCEQVLDELGLNQHFALVPLGEIQKQSSKYQAFLHDPATDHWAVTSFKQAIARERSAVYETSQRYEDAARWMGIELDKLRDERDSINAERNRIRVERDAMKAALNEILSSYSWHITAPLRKIIGRGRTADILNRLFPLRTLPNRAMQKVTRLSKESERKFANLSGRLFPLRTLPNRAMQKATRLSKEGMDKVINRVKSWVHGTGKASPYFSIAEEHTPMLPQVRIIYFDLIRSIKETEDSQLNKAEKDK
jgi:hypothetical protein